MLVCSPNFQYSDFSKSGIPQGFIRREISTCTCIDGLVLIVQKVLLVSNSIKQLMCCSILQHLRHRVTDQALCFILYQVPFISHISWV